LTALVATPIALYLFWQGGTVFAAGMLFLALAAWFEYVQMMKTKALRPVALLGGISVAAIVCLSWLHGLAQLAPLSTAVLFLFLSLTVVNHDRFGIPDAAYNILGILYIGIPFAHFIALRLLPDSLGVKYFAVAMLGTWACDTVAYFGGSRWGRHKLCPSISPGKSVEGAIFGFFGCISAALIAGHFMQLAWIDRILCGCLVGISCQLGDLVESSFKRFMGVKDSGRIFPGHGGVLDRVDSLMFSIPAVYYYLVFLAGRQ
jgi:phosphatidate cytidylyltransferase